MKIRGAAEMDRLREAFSRGDMDAPSGECPDPGVLWASAAGELDPAANEAVLLHLARCGPCSSIWRLAREMARPEEAGGSQVAPLDEGRRPPIWRRPGVLAAAATLLVAVGLGTGVLMERRHATSPPVYRRQPSPSGIVASPGTGVLPRSRCLLRWSGAPAGSRFDLTVTGKELGVLAMVRGLTAAEYLLPQDRIPEGTHEILWRVTAHLPHGGILRSKTFTSRIED